MSEHQMNVTSDKTLLLLSGQFETLMSIHYAHVLQRTWGSPLGTLSKLNTAYKRIHSYEQPLF